MRLRADPGKDRGKANASHRVPAGFLASVVDGNIIIAYTCASQSSARCYGRWINALRSAG